MSSRHLRMALLAFAVFTMLGGDCDGKGPDFFDLIDGGLDPFTGDIFGRVTVDGSPRSGVTVTVREGMTVVATRTTDSNGEYEVLELDPGSYTVSVGAITGADCPGDQTATVVADDETEVNFPCTTPQPTTGTVTGTVTVNGVPEPNLTVTLLEGTTVIATRPTDLNGVYTFQNVSTGTKTVMIATPSDPPATCPGPQDVTVAAGGTATADFPCTRPSGDFIVVFTQIVTDHRGQTSVICWVTTTSPAQPGATFQGVATGPGVLTPAFSGALNANGQAAVEVVINLFGTYNIGQIVTSGANEASALATHTVDQTEGDCAVAQSSIRFKQGVIALLPDDVRPLGLRPVAFRYREPWGDPAEPRIGLLAEEVAEVFPTAVFLDAEGRPESIHYGILARSVTEEVSGWTGGVARAAIARLAEAF